MSAWDSACFTNTWLEKVPWHRRCTGKIPCDQVKQDMQWYRPRR